MKNNTHVGPLKDRLPSYAEMGDSFQKWTGRTEHLHTVHAYRRKHKYIDVLLLRERDLWSVF